MARRKIPLGWRLAFSSARPTSEDPDEYLRAIWLECCGHLSQFNIGGMLYDRLGVDPGYLEGCESMEVSVDRLFSVGLTQAVRRRAQFDHEE